MRRIKPIIKTTLLLLSTSITAFATFLLLRDAPLSSVPVVEANAPLPEPVTTYERPYLPAIFPILGSVFVLWGVWIKKMVAAWLGVGVLIVYSVLFVFSWGGVFLVPAFLLALLLLVYHLLYRRELLSPS